MAFLEDRGGTENVLKVARIRMQCNNIEENSGVAPDSIIRTKSSMRIQRMT